jgi:hypothetical protein
MKKKLSSKRTRRAPKTLLRVPDLDYAKAAVPNSLTSEDEFAIGYQLRQPFGRLLHRPPVYHEYSAKSWRLANTAIEQPTRNIEHLR